MLGPGCAFVVLSGCLPGLISGIVADQQRQDAADVARAQLAAQRQSEAEAEAARAREEAAKAEALRKQNDEETRREAERQLVLRREQEELEQRGRELAGQQEQASQRLAEARRKAESDAKRAGRRVYLGPLGLLWGQSLEDIKLVLDGRGLRFMGEEQDKDGKVSVLQYAGNLAEFVSDSIMLFFLDGTFVGALVVLREPDIVPAHRRWQRVVDVMTTRYGKANQLAAAPTSSMLTTARAMKSGAVFKRSGAALESLAKEQEDDFLEGEILRGKWGPKAVWNFADSRVGAEVEVSRPDEDGRRSLRVAWYFWEMPRAKRLGADSVKGPLQDF